MDMTDAPKAPSSNSSPNSYASLAMPLLALIQPTALSFPPLSAPSAHPPTTSALSAVHIAALECLNNIFLSLASSPSPSISAEVNSGLQIWNAIWAALELVGTQTGPGQERRQEFWEIAVGVLWNVGRIWKGVLVRLVSLQFDHLVTGLTLTFFLLHTAREQRTNLSPPTTLHRDVQHPTQSQIYRDPRIARSKPFIHRRKQGHRRFPTLHSPFPRYAIAHWNRTDGPSRQLYHRHLL